MTTLDIQDLTVAIAIADGCEVEPHVGDNRWLCTCGFHGSNGSLIIPLHPSMEWCLKVLRETFPSYKIFMDKDTIELKTRRTLDEPYYSQYFLIENGDEVECLARMILGVME